MISKNNDLLVLTSPITRYSPWWRLSDKNHKMMKVCETMVRIISRASHLKRDDYRLKGAPASHRTCERCDHYALENIQHITMQCPAYSKEREEMFGRINNECPNVSTLMEENPPMNFAWMMGRDMEGISDEEQDLKLTICGTAISEMYRKCISSRVGVG